MDVLIETLQAAGSQNAEVVKQAEAKLKEWETNQGFFSKLLEVFMMRSLEMNTRWIAIIFFKNGINKYWRRGRSGISEEEKIFIRERITIFDEPVHELAIQVAVIIGRIARSDLRCWPDCINKILQVIQTGDDLCQHRGLLSLNEVCKELASKRLVTDRRFFQEVTNNIFTFLEELCYHHISPVFSIGALSSIEMAILVMKILRKLLHHSGCNYSEMTPQVRYLKWCVQNVNRFYEHRNQRPEKREKYEKLMLLSLKTLTDFVTDLMEGFEGKRSQHTDPILSDVIQLSSQHILSNTNNNEENSKIVIQSGNILRHVTVNVSRLPVECFNIIRTIMTDDWLRTFSHHTVMGYFPLTRSEMTEWEHDPEEYVNVEAGESCKFLLRPCMESLYVGLFFGFKVFMRTFVVELIKELNNVNLETASQDDLLKVCAIYKAVGLPSYELFGDVDFDVWFRERLLKIFNLPNEKFSVVQQHVLWMIGEWINVKLSKANRVLLYRLIGAILCSNTADLVLKLTACKVLRCAVDDFDFVLEDFQLFLNDIFPAIGHLLVTSEECDSKMMILNVLSILIERTGKEVGKNLDMLIQYLPQLWEMSAQHNLLRGAVVNVLHHLVKGLGRESGKIDNLTLPVIHLSTDVTQAAHVYLLEDGLELWHSVISNSSRVSKDSLLMFDNMFPLLERASETLDICLEITRTYLFIDATTFIKQHSLRLSQCFHELLGNIKEEAASKIAAIFRLMIQLQPVMFAQHFSQNLLDVFEQVVNDANYPPLMTKYLSILAYLVINQTEGFFQVGQAYSHTTIRSYEEIMEQVFAVWMEKIDCMLTQEKKLAMIALMSLLPQKVSFIMNRFSIIVDSCVNVLYDLQRGSNIDGSQSNQQDSLVGEWYFEEDEADGDVSFADIQEKKLMAHDCIYTVNMVRFVQEKLTQAKMAYGEVLFNEAMSNLDPVVANQLMQLLR